MHEHKILTVYGLQLTLSMSIPASPTIAHSAIFSATCNIYISRLCYDVCVRLSVCPSVCDGSALAHYS